MASIVSTVTLQLSFCEAKILRNLLSKVDQEVDDIACLWQSFLPEEQKVIIDIFDLLDELRGD